MGHSFGMSFPAELEGCSRVTVAVLNDMAICGIAELEQSIGIVVAGLLDRAVMAVPVLVHDGIVAKAVLQHTGNIAQSLLLDASAFAETVAERINRKSGADDFSLLSVCRVDGDGKCTTCLGRGDGRHSGEEHGSGGFSEGRSHDLCLSLKRFQEKGGWFAVGKRRVIQRMRDVLQALNAFAEGFAAFVGRSVETCGYRGFVNRA